MNDKTEVSQLSADEYSAIFFPHFHRQRAAIQENGRPRFVYYTSAETAVSIIRTKKIWMRSTMTMNDYAEIEYGFGCLKKALNDEPGTALKAALDSIHEGLSSESIDRFNAWLPGIRRDTFITCVSEHLDTEDEHGRLSMWRAYGGRDGVALVLNGAPMFSESEALAAYSSPVAYLDEAGVARHMTELAESVKANAARLSSLDRSSILGSMFEVFRAAVLCTKHPGFSEEREWRIYSNPAIQTSPHLVQDVAVVRGTPQVVLKLPLNDFPEEGLTGMELPDLLDRIIIGPCEFPEVSHRAFWHLLKEHGVDDPNSKIFVSGIPLRHF